jgi:hypothetical protein
VYGETKEQDIFIDYSTSAVGKGNRKRLKREIREVGGLYL